MRIVRLARTALAALAALTLAPLVADAVLVAPHALFIDDRERSGDVFLVNSSDTPEEVSLEFRFGYPTTDSAGDVRLTLIPEPDSTQPSAARWLRAFPRRVRLEPGQRQRVRVQATPPAGLPDGEYWSRLIVTSRAARPPLAVGGDSAVQAGITFELRTITSVTYRKGALSTGIRLDEFRAAAAGDTLEAWLRLVREGTAAYLGSVRLELRDSAGRAVDDLETPIAVYTEQHRRFALPLDAVAPGRYTLRLLVSTARQDIGAEHVLPADPIARTLEVEVGR
ncbi:MAG TPA: hypothetical protein VFH97_09695 [Gemmatimonadales bacterium]|nr:hypothetical protein [Gemmatimonadales bacterium]